MVRSRSEELENGQAYSYADTYVGQMLLDGKRLSTNQKSTYTKTLRIDVMREWSVDCNDVGR